MGKTQKIKVLVLRTEEIKQAEGSIALMQFLGFQIYCKPESHTMAPSSIAQ